MIDTRLAALAARQEDVVATWQLMALGWTKAMVAHRLRGTTRLYDGVHLLSHRAPRVEQRWWAASLTTPTSRLALASAAASYGMFPNPRMFEIITRPGFGGPVQQGRLLVVRTRSLTPADVSQPGGLRRTTVERTLVDLAPHLTTKQLRKAFREALRLKLTTALAVRQAADRHRGRRGVVRLRALADRYVRLPIHRCRSDAEAMALELLDGAGRPIPRVNEVVAGGEADQWWPDLQRVIEIDSRGFHQLRDDDARKTAAWRAAGLQVDRIMSDDVFDHPERYLALAPPRNRARVSIQTGDGRC